jgi:hypothetical protein
MLTVYFTTGDEVTGEFAEVPGNDMAAVVDYVDGITFALFKEVSGKEIVLSTSQIIKITPA